MHEQEVTKISFEPTKLDAKKRLMVLDDLDVPLYGVKITRGAFVAIGPGGWAANHRHNRHELLLAISGDLYIIWRDKQGIRRQEQMSPADGTLQVYSIPPRVPHLVENRSQRETAVLHEWSSDILGETEDLKGSESLLSTKA